jgi:hypothetical protein
VSRTKPVLISALLAIPVLALAAGCAAGNNAQTLQPYSPADGIVANSGNVRVLNALVVADPGGNTGVVSMTIVNRGTRLDGLTNLTSSSGAVDFTGTRNLPPRVAVRFGATTEPAATISGLTAKPGQTITLSLTFQRSRPLRIATVVLPATGAYSSLTPGPATPAAEVTDTPTDTSSASPSSSG